METTENLQTFMDAVADTPFCSVAVKKKGKKLGDLFNDEYGHGIIVSPPTCRMDVHNDIELAIRMAAADKVVVRGHGWNFEAKFVWTGTGQEFNETWVGD